MESLPNQPTSTIPHQEEQSQVHPYNTCYRRGGPIRSVNQASKPDRLADLRASNISSPTTNAKTGKDRKMRSEPPVRDHTGRGSSKCIRAAQDEVPTRPSTILAPEFTSSIWLPTSPKGVSQSQVNEPASRNTLCQAGNHSRGKVDQCKPPVPQQGQPVKAYQQASACQVPLPPNDTHKPTTR